VRVFLASLVLAGIINILFAVTVFAKNRQRLPNRVFPLCSLNLAAWCFVVFGIVVSRTLEQADVYVRIACAVGAFIPANFRFFVATLGLRDNTVSPRQK
jgi:hypothetical protein